MIGSRAGTAMWVTSSGEVYIFGGSSPWGKKNDLWKFSPQQEPNSPNDEPCNAATLTLDDQPYYGSNAFATSDATDNTGTCPGINSVWLKYSPTTSGFVQFTLGPGVSGDSLSSYLKVYVPTVDNCPNGLTLADSTSTTFGSCKYYYMPISKNPTIFSSFLSTGKTYYFKIIGIGNDVGRYSLSLQSTNITNLASGNWHDPTIWSNGKVPSTQSIVTISFPVDITADAVCGSLTVVNTGQVTVKSGVMLTVLNSLIRPGSALNFDGVNDYISIPHNNLLKPTNGITIEAWINPKDIHTTFYSEIYRKEDGNARQLLSFQNNGTLLSFGLGIAGVYSELDVPISAATYEGQWIHVAATFDGSTKKIYRNGTLIGSQVVTGLISTTGTAPAIIGSSSGNSEFFNGSIDEFKLWDHAIQVDLKMNCEITKPENGLLIYYKFNQGSAGGANGAINKILDSSGNTFDGLLLNFLLSGNNSNWITPGGVQTGNYCTN